MSIRLCYVFLLNSMFNQFSHSFVSHSIHEKYWLLLYCSKTPFKSIHVCVCTIDGHRVRSRASIKHTQRKAQDLKWLLFFWVHRCHPLFQYFEWTIAWTCVSAYACVTFNNHIRQLLHSNIIYIFHFECRSFETAHYFFCLRSPLFDWDLFCFKLFYVFAHFLFLHTRRPWLTVELQTNISL